MMEWKIETWKKRQATPIAARKVNQSDGFTKKKMR